MKDVSRNHDTLHGAPRASHSMAQRRGSMMTSVTWSLTAQEATQSTSEEDVGSEGMAGRARGMNNEEVGK